MARVEVSRFVQATPAAVKRLLSPETLITYEGTFTPRDVTETEEGTVLTVAATGIETRFRFEEREDGLAYELEGSDTAGPFDEMATELTVEAQDEGSRVVMASEVSLKLPVPLLSDRIAGWKRRGELRRALARLAADAE